jgi:protein ImuA
MRIINAPSPLYSDAPPIRRWSCGIDAVDAALGGGLAYGSMHEIYAGEVGDAAAAAGFTLAAATGMSGGGISDGANGTPRPMLWLRSRRCVGAVGVFQGAGWADLGGAHDGGLMGVVGDTVGLMRAAVDGLRCGALGAVVMECWGAMRELDLTATRRFALAAEQSGVPLFVLRVDAAPAPSAARTRWQICAAPSQGLAQAGPGQAPGRATFDVTLLRQRSGPSGLEWRLEWDREQCQFREALSGAVVSAPVHRQVPDRTGRQHAA